MTSSFIQGHSPTDDDQILETIGHYQILKLIGKGGMGEVLLAYDTRVGRRIALKKIRGDLVEHPHIQNRFLKEAKITAQLTHPSIIPIYTIHDDEGNIYYTMPHMQGETLKEILRETRKEEKLGITTAEGRGSISSLIRIFLSVAQAIAYAHSKGVLHRDIKPENIILGKYGEVLILDWGLAKLIKNHENDNLPEIETDQTRMGKVVGTISYMAPERARKKPASIQTDVYSLGVILYQILTLRFPFHRPSLKEFRERIDKEEIPDPFEVAPYREIPRILSQMALRCLDKDPSHRYETVDEMIHELEGYIEGRSEWYPIKELDIEAKEDWEFQENILIAEHVAITRNTEESDWVILMISKTSFTGNTKLEAKVKIGETGQGMGFLLSVPEAAERMHLTDGYCVWIGSDLNPTTKLLRSSAEVGSAPETVLKRGEWQDIRIEKTNTHFQVYINNTLQLSHVAFMPLAGTHVGLFSRDIDFEIKDLVVSVSSPNITINCLSVPDSFLAHKQYDSALIEYRRIGYSFPGRTEGREAMFRAGITLLDQAKNSKNPEMFDLALTEFEKLHRTPGAPLEYLGKSLVYQATKEDLEEAKCFELALRRFKNHPLLPHIKEQIISRLHESARSHRRATYRLAMLVAQHLPESMGSPPTKKLTNKLKKNWEPLPFLFSVEGEENDKFAITLAFWLSKSHILSEIVDHLQSLPNPPIHLISHALFCLIELGGWNLAEKKVISLEGDSIEALKPAILAHRQTLADGRCAILGRKRDALSPFEICTMFHLMECAIMMKQTNIVYELAEHMLLDNLNAHTLELCHSFLIFSYLIDRDLTNAGELLEHYSIDYVAQDHSYLHFLYGAWLAATEGQEISEIHFSGVLNVVFPRTYSLLSHYLNHTHHEREQWESRAFLWEKRLLYLQLALYLHCLDDEDQAEYYFDLARKQRVEVSD
ncbi:MAG: serine/threonine-protein kinase PknD [Waddliaceae bacterium]